MTSESQAYHDGHTDEVNRVRALQRHENTVRELERARVKRNLLSLLSDPDPTEIDFGGCTT